MYLSDHALQEIFDNFPLLQEIFIDRFTITKSEFYALSSLRPKEMSSKVHEVLLWISDQVSYIPPVDIQVDVKDLSEMQNP